MRTDLVPGAARPVVWIIDSLKLGGAERLALAFAAASGGTRPAVLMALQPPPPGAAWAGREGGGEPGVETLAMRSLHDVGQWTHLLGRLRHLQPRLIHTHLRYATIWGGMAAQVLGVPHVATLHSLPANERQARQRWAARWEQRTWRAADRVIYVSRAQAEAWRGRGAMPAAARCRVVANGVAVGGAGVEAKAALRLRFGIAQDRWVALTVAVVRARKGWQVWLDTITRLAPVCPEAVFLWVGGGPDEAGFEAAVRAHPWRGQIRLLGTQTEVGDWLRMADVFLFPSLEEALPTAVLEAMAAGLPVVASDLPAVAEVLGEGGTKVGPGDAAGMATAAAAWYGEAGRAARERVGRAGAERVRQCFSQERWREELWSSYDEVLAERRTHPAGGIFRTRRTAAL